MRKSFNFLRKAFHQLATLMPLVQPKKIAVLTDTAVTFSRMVINGVAKYAQQKANWQLLFQARGVNDRSSIPQHWQVDGVIARVTHKTQAKQLLQLSIPVINISRSVVPGYAFPQASIDECEVAHLAVEHLWNQGLRTLAYFNATDQANYYDRMWEAFLDHSLNHNANCLRFIQKHRRGLNKEYTIQELESWLQSLPKPIGILAWDAVHGHFLRETCLTAGFNIPEEIAIISGEDDELFCQLSSPSLSAIDCCPDRLGYASAEKLDDLMTGIDLEDSPTLLPAIGVISRHSTDILAVEDRELAQALRFLREHAYESIQIRDILKQVPMSRRALEMRFKKLLGRSPAAELRRLRISKAQELLTNTNWSIPKIASASGFSQAEVMNRVFRRELDQTPTIYRASTRAD